jgi:hypothetical protein
MGHLTRTIGTACALSFALNLWATTTEPVNGWIFAGSLIGAGISGGLTFHFCARLFERLAATVLRSAQAMRRYNRAQPFSYIVGLAACVGAFGYSMTLRLFLVMAVVFISAQVMCVAWAIRPQRTAPPAERTRVILFPLFFISGFAALLYQVVWQRVLFSEVGSNTESVAIIVSIFMLGLGLGSLLGGRLTRVFPSHLPHLFVAIELLIGSFGLISVNVIRNFAAVLLHAPEPVTFAGMALLLSLPTMCMGATLPILVTYLNSQIRNIGRSVGLLYAINTLGSAVGALFTVHLLLLITGQKGVTYVAATCNLTVSVVAWLTMTRGEYPFAVNAMEATPAARQEG